MVTRVLRKYSCQYCTYTETFYKDMDNNIYFLSVLLPTKFSDNSTSPQRLNSRGKDDPPKLPPVRQSPCLFLLLFFFGSSMTSKSVVLQQPTSESSRFIFFSSPPHPLSPVHIIIATIITFPPESNSNFVFLIRHNASKTFNKLKREKRCCCVRSGESDQAARKNHCPQAAFTRSQSQHGRKAQGRC